MTGLGEGIHGGMHVFIFIIIISSVFVCLPGGWGRGIEEGSDIRLWQYNMPCQYPHHHTG